MSQDKNHSEQIKRYLNGQMTSEEANAFEREVLDDPFGQEALEGYEIAGIDALKDIDSLKKKIIDDQSKSFPFLRIAAVVALLIVGSFTVYKFSNQIEGERLAMEEEQVKEMIQSSPSPDTIAAISQNKPSQQIVADQTTKKGNDDSNTRVQEEVKYESEEILAEEMEQEETVSVPDVKKISIPANSQIEIAEIEDAEIVKTTAIDKESTDVNSLSGRVAGVKIKRNRVDGGIDPDEAKKINAYEYVVGIKSNEPIIEPTSNDELLDSQVGQTKSIASASSSKKQKIATSRSGIADSNVLIGHIIDENDEALPGATVIIKGTASGTTTDIDGFFELPKRDSMTLIISYVGFESLEIEVGDRSYVETSLAGDLSSLQEVVVTGFGEQRDADTNYTPAQPSGGNRAYKKYLEENLQYPEVASTNKIEGTVVLQLTINELGTVTEIEVKKSLGYECDQEAIRLVREGPDWDSAEIDGNNIEDKLKVRVKFKLDR